MKKEEAIKRIYDSAKIYEQNLKNKNFLFIFNDKDKKTLCFETIFLPRNFLHLTGVKIDSSKIRSSVDFYNLCVKQKLSINDFEFESDGTTKMKLMVLPQLMNIHKEVKMVGEYNATKVRLKTQKLAGNVRACLGFTLDNEYYIPNTALKEDLRDITYKPQQQIIGIFSKRIEDNFYQSVRYLPKKVKFEELKLPKEIWDKIDKENIIKDF